VGKFAYLFISISITAFFLTSCSKSEEQRYTEAAQLLASFHAEPAAVPIDTSATELIAEQYYIGVPKAALQIVDNHGNVTQKATEFLLSGSMIPQAGAPTSTALNGKVVFFEMFNDAVDMYESTEGIVVTDDLPARRLLAKFPIVSQDNTKVVINFDEGFKTLFVADWISGGSEFEEGLIDAVLDTPVTRVFSLSHTPGRLTIAQSVQARVSFLGSVVTPRMEMRYYLTPYTATAYVPKTVKDTRHVRYFKSFPNLEKTSGKSRTHILRFDVSNPITFSYSANTPKEFEQAVKDGITYWNLAFGKEVIKAEKAPQGVTAPHPDYNVVQWVPWDSAGFAYADVIADPRTGRSLHGQVYLTSVFGIKGIERARIALRQLQAVAAKAPTESPKGKVFNRLGIRFLGEGNTWQPGGHCEQHAHEAAASVANGLATLLSLENVTDQRILEMSQNYVREVVAHEVGHVLGLRHHFAANLQATLSAKEQADWVQRALVDGRFETDNGKFSATSVMEYTEFFAAAHTGQKIKEAKEILPYDNDAIQWGYFGKEDVNDKQTLYCSDEEATSYKDCERFDPTGDTFLGTHIDIVRTIGQLPGLFLENYVAAVAPADPIDKVKVEEVNLTATFGLKTIADALGRSLAWFNGQAKLIAIDNRFPFIGPLNVDARLDARWEILQKKIEAVGGTDRLLFSHLPLPLTLDLATQPEAVVAPVKYSRQEFVAKVNALLDGPTYSKFIGLNGREHAFTDDEKKVIRQRASEYAEYYEEQLLKLTLSSLGQNKLSLAREAEGMSDSETILAKIEKQYVGIAKEIITAVHPTKKVHGKVRTAQVTVEDFKYPKDVRMLATAILAKDLGSQPYWADDARVTIRNTLNSYLESKLLMKDIQGFKESDLSRVLRAWHSEQRSILSSLPE
jgi:hypothetical protein